MSIQQKLIQYFIGKEEEGSITTNDLFALMIKEPSVLGEAMVKASEILEESGDQLSIAMGISEQFATFIARLTADGLTWEKNIEPLINLFLSLGIEPRPYLLREGLNEIGAGEFVKVVAGRLGGEAIVATIVQSIKQRDQREDILALILFLAPTGEKRRSLLSLLRQALIEQAIPAIQYTELLADGIWSELSFNDKIQLLLKYDVTGMGDIDSVKEVIEELLLNREIEKTEIIINKIISNLRDPSENIRLKAVETLSAIIDLLRNTEYGKKTLETLLNLIERMLDDDDEQVRFAALETIAFRGNKKSLPKLYNLIKKRGLFNRKGAADFKKSAIEAIGKIGDLSSITELTALLEAKSFLTFIENTDNRIAAVQAIGSIGGRQAILILEATSRSDNRKEVQEAATIALNKLHQEDDEPLL